MMRHLSAASAVVLTLGCGSGDGSSAGHEGPVGGAEADGGEPRAGGDSGAEGVGEIRCEDAGVICYDFGPIDVPPGGEWQGFQALAVENEEPLAITGIEIDQVGATSHHFTVALWAEDQPPPSGGPYDLLSSDGLKFVGATLSNALVGSVYKYVKIDTGKYVGVPLPKNAYIVSNGHYLNTAVENQTGHTTVKIKTVPAGEVDFMSINALPGTNAIDVPPKTKKTVGSTWDPPVDVAVMLMTSHMHQHGTLFEVWKVVDGAESKIYSTTDYEAPPLKIFASKDEAGPLVLRKDRGDHLRFECTHENDDLDQDLVYGPSALTNEMCIMPIYYIEEPDAFLRLFEESRDASGFTWEYVPNGG